ncbi:hypothetical protein Q3G72_020222 [Acer saccharum]|nr:hypothetical protein Q3G72_020222 [Acer saccharum]
MRRDQKASQQCKIQNRNQISATKPFLSAATQHSTPPITVVTNLTAVVDMADEEENETMRLSRKEKKKLAKKKKRKEKRKETAETEREKAEDPEEQRKLEAMLREAEEERKRALKEFEDRERLWIQAMELKKKEEEEEEEDEERRKAIKEEEEAERRLQVEKETECDEDDDWEYVEEGPAEIIWQGNEIIIKKKKVRVLKKDASQLTGKEDIDTLTSNPLPPQSEVFSDYKSAQQALESVARQVPNFGTEQDKAHCPFHLKTGACRFGQSCSRVHFYPDKSCTLLIKNMYNGPGLAWEQDEGLERFLVSHRWSLLTFNYYTDEEVERSYEEFYEDVHTEFLKFGEIVNFKVCKNGSFHLRGNVYVHYKSLESAVLAYQSANGRYFAGKQINCEFVSLTRWKVAICGEYMKSRFKACSHGTACNFIHCFRNPGGDYEWADWDKTPPKFWVKKMTALFGYSDEYGYEKQVDQDNVGPRRNSNNFSAYSDRHRCRRSRSREMDHVNGGSGRSRDDENDLRESTRNQRRNDDTRKRIRLLDEKFHKESTKFKDYRHSKCRNDETDLDGSWSDRDRDKDRGRQHGHSRKSTQHRCRSSEKSAAYENSKRRIHEDDSKGNRLDEDSDAQVNHARTKKSLRYRDTRELEDDNEDHENRTHDSDIDRQDSDEGGEREPSYLGKRSRDWSKVGYLDTHEESEKKNEDESSGDRSDRDADRDRDRHLSHKRKSSRHWSQVLELRDGHSVGKYRGRDIDSGDDSDKERQERHHGHRRKRSQYRTEESELSYKLKENFNNGESESERSNLKRGRTHKHSSKRSSSGRENNKAYYRHSKPKGDHEFGSPGQCDERCISISKNDRWEHASLEEDQNSRRKTIIVQNYESSSPGRYNGRCKSQHLASDYLCNDKDDDDHRESNEDAYEEHHKLRSKSTCDDKDQFSGDSNSHNEHSSDLYGERR